jgi:hypothetical protein
VVVGFSLEISQSILATGLGGSTMKLIAILLVVVGLVVLGYQGITYTTRQKAIDVGSVHVETEKTRTLPLPPLVGAVVLIAGIVLLIRENKKA